MSVGVVIEFHNTAMEDDIHSTFCENIYLDSNSSSSETENELQRLLDPTSESFNPVIALHSAVVPQPKNGEAEEVPLYLHVHEFIKAVPDPKQPPVMESALKTRNKPKVAPVPPPSKPATDGDGPAPFYPIPGRRFLPHQLPVYRPRKQQPSVLTNMEVVQGPLGQLRKYMNDKEKVIVWTRSGSGIRGFCLGFIQGFDMNWNLALDNVVEVFQRRRVPTIHKSVNKLQKPAGCRAETEDSEMLLADPADALATLRTVAVQKKILPVSKLQNAGKGVFQEKVSGSQLRKKRLCLFKDPEKDIFGFEVIAKSQKVEIVQRRQKHLFLMGNEVAFVEREKT